MAPTAKPASRVTTAKQPVRRILSRAKSTKSTAAVRSRAATKRGDADADVLESKAAATEEKEEAGGPSATAFYASGSSTDASEESDDTIILD